MAQLRLMNTFIIWKIINFATAPFNTKAPNDSSSCLFFYADNVFGFGFSIGWNVCFLHLCAVDFNIKIIDHCLQFSFFFFCAFNSIHKIIYHVHVASIFSFNTNEFLLGLTSIHLIMLLGCSMGHNQMQNSIKNR